MVKFIADIGSNHNQDWWRCQLLMETAKQIGCQAVKFQLFRAEKVYAPECKEQIAEMKENELNLEWLPRIKQFCQDNGLEFICSPFDLDAVDILEPFVDAYKIASYELLWDELLQAILRKNKPIIFSTGLATASEIHRARQILITAKDLTILHCSAKYPSQPSDCNLKEIYWLTEQYRARIGWSDHTVNPLIINAAIAMGAEVVEFHLDLEDMRGRESKHGHCWRPSDIKDVIKNHHQILEAFVIKKIDEELRLSRRDPDGFRPMKSIRR